MSVLCLAQLCETEGSLVLRTLGVTGVLHNPDPDSLQAELAVDHWLNLGQRSKHLDFAIMPRKRKSAAPQRADPVKRSLLTWNMLDPDNVALLADAPSHVQMENHLPSSNESTRSETHCEAKLKSMIDSSSFSLQLFHSLPAKKERTYHLASFDLHILSAHFLLDIWRKSFRLYVSDKSENNFMYCEAGVMDGGQPSQPLYCHWHSLLSYPTLEALQQRCITLKIHHIDVTSKKLTVNIFITEVGLTKIRFSSQGSKMKKSNYAIQQLMTEFYNFPQEVGVVPGSVKNLAHDLEELYEVIQRHHTCNPLLVRVNAQHSLLKPRLREYQWKAVQWMVTTEKEFKQVDSDALHSLYKEVTLLDNQKLFYNQHGGYLVYDKPMATQRNPGGILADEMGLGKTVEVFACVLAHTRPGFSVPGQRSLPEQKPKNVAESLDPVATVSENDPARGMDLVLPSNSYVTPPASMSSFMTDDSSQCSVTDSHATVNYLISESTTGQILTASSAPIGSSTSKEDTLIGSSDASTSHNFIGDTCDLAEEVVIEEMGGVKICTHTVDINGVPVETSQAGKGTKKGKKSKPRKKASGERQLSENADNEEKHDFIECVCGRQKGKRKVTLTNIQCCVCGTWQHAECVHYSIREEPSPPYLCPHCHIAAPPVESGATLIITPTTICHQWLEEIHKHIHSHSLKVIVYAGVHQAGFLQPTTLADADIVITTYETLRKEIDYVDLPHSKDQSGRRFRKPKRYMAIPSPIVAVEWWRICLDEAQMVECTTTKTAEMALRLSAVNRWCVTGTPIQRDIRDLYGLLLFLGVDPYWVHHWWNKLLYEPYCHGDKKPLQDVLSQVLWRTAKKDVIDQVMLPGQSEKVLWLGFTPVEEHFYRQQYEACAAEARQKLRKLEDHAMPLSSLDRYTLHQVLQPVLRLRQACCHPQVVRGEFLPLNKSTMTMAELLGQLIKKTKTEAEEAHRQFIAATNGMAALSLIQQQLDDAIDKYREVLRSVEEHKNRVRTDELQQLHTLYNLGQTLALRPEATPTLRDHLLDKQVDEIREKYLIKAQAFVTVKQDTWAPLHKTLTEQHKQFVSGKDWWADILQWAVYTDLDLQLTDKIRTDLSDNASPHTLTIANSFHDARGLEYILASKLEEIDSYHGNLVKTLRTLQKPPSRDLINKTVECCLRPDDQTLRNCLFCKAEDMLREYESKLFAITDKGVKDMGGDEDNGQFAASVKRQGTWADSETEKALKSLISFTKAHTGDLQLVEYGNLHMKMFDTLKKEFKSMRGVWMALKEHVSAYDELDMATTRLRLRLSHEPKLDVPQTNIIEPSEIEQHRLRLMSDRVIGRNDLRRKLGQLLYLQNLEKAHSTVEIGNNPDQCPVCHHELGSKWSVLQCGHCYCLECIRVLVEKYSFGRLHCALKCPVCRDRTYHRDISYVSTHDRMQEECDPDLRVKGDHSTKVIGVVKCLLQIKKENPTAKSLVFSTWQDVLYVISKALEDNEIPYRSLSSYKFQESLHSFRTDEDVRVLLLPVHSGANGLNLIEATHVILVEPILNPAQEMQAIGRVHRIGQTRETVVHRLLVRGTIEERIQQLLQSVSSQVINAHNADDTPLTVGDLHALFTDEPDDGDAAAEDDTIATNEDRRGDIDEISNDNQHVRITETQVEEMADLRGGNVSGGREDPDSASVSVDNGVVDTNVGSVSGVCGIIDSNVDVVSEDSGVISNRNVPGENNVSDDTDVINTNYQFVSGDEEVIDTQSEFVSGENAVIHTNDGMVLGDGKVIYTNEASLSCDPGYTTRKDASLSGYIGDICALDGCTCDGSVSVDSTQERNVPGNIGTCDRQDDKNHTIQGILETNTCHQDPRETDNRLVDGDIFNGDIPSG